MSAHTDLVDKINAAMEASSEPIKCFRFGQRTYMNLRLERDFCGPLDLRGEVWKWYGIPFIVTKLPSDVNEMTVVMEEPLDSAEIGYEVFTEMAAERSKR